MRKIASLITLLAFLASPAGFAADKKISELTLGTASGVATNDSFPYVDTATGTTKRLRVSELFSVPALSTALALKANLAGPTFTGTTTTATFVNTGNATFDTNTLYVDSADNEVGIGTTSPAYSLHVVRTSAAAMGAFRSSDHASNTRLLIGNDVEDLTIGVNTSGFGLLYSAASKDMIIGSNGTPTTRNITIKSGGGIDMTESLTVNSNIINVGKASSGLGGNIRMINDAGTVQWLTGILGSGGATAYVIRDMPNSADRISINASTGVVTVTNGIVANSTLNISGLITAVDATFTGSANFNAGGTLAVSGDFLLGNGPTATGVAGAKGKAGELKHSQTGTVIADDETATWPYGAAAAGLVQIYDASSGNYCLMQVDGAGNDVILAELDAGDLCVESDTDNKIVVNYVPGTGVTVKNRQGLSRTFYVNMWRVF